MSAHGTGQDRGKSLVERKPAALEATYVPADPRLDMSTPVPIATSDRFPRLFGIAVIVVAFGFVGGWASFASIDGAVLASGTVTVDSYRKTVQHLEGGIVQRIHVRDGDTVRRGDLLIELDETQARANYLVSYNRYMTELARQARLEAEMLGHGTIPFPDRLTAGDGDDTRAARIMATEEQEFHARLSAREGEMTLIRQRIDQLGERVAGMQAQRSARLRTVASLEQELESLNRLAERELVPASDLFPRERQLSEAEGEAGELRAQIAATRIEIGEAELRILQLNHDFTREVAAQLRETLNMIDALEEELRALEDTLRRKAILAPVPGEVVNLQVHSEWGVIRPGEPILDLVPSGEPLVVEARVRPQDVDSVTTGMMADIRFTAFSFRTTPVVEGEVVFVSADRLEDPKTGEPYFLSRLIVSDEALRALGPVNLRPGMPADVMIKTGARTPLQYLLKPLTDALARSFTES